MLSETPVTFRSEISFTIHDTNTVMKIVIVISSLGPGGAERSATTMGNAWSDIGRDVTLVTLDDPKNRHFYSLRSSIKRIALGVKAPARGLYQAIKNTVSTVKILRHQFQLLNPDCIVSFIDTTNIITLLANRGLSIPTIITERVYPPKHRISPRWSLLRQITYPWTDLLVVQTTDIKGFFSPGVQRRTLVIPNVLSKESYADTHSKSVLTGRKKIVAMGRLAPQKRFDLLLKAFYDLGPLKDVTLTILGEGPLRPRLEALRNELGLDDSVFLPGLIANPGSILRQADIFVLSSEYEGFPNALIEAMACGCAVVSFDCPTGPREIIRQGYNGILVAPLDVQGLCVAMQQLLTDDSLRANLAQKALSVREIYSTEKIMLLWEDAFNQAMAKYR